MLDRNVVKVLLFEVGCGLHFDQPPAVVSTTMQDVHPYKHTTVLERSLEDGRNLGICDQLAGNADRLLGVARTDFHAARKKLTCKSADLAALLHDGNRCGVRDAAQFWFMHLPIQTLEALAACDEFAIWK